MRTADTQTIFVQIPAYRDPQLVETLDSLIGQARHPERLRIAICWQRAPQDRLPKRLERMTNLEIDHVDYRASRGANWARRRIQKQWRDEPWSLVIDSHLRFVHHWDAKLLRMMEHLKAEGIAKPVITCYPPDFNPKTFPAGLSRAPLKIYKEAYIDGLLVHFAGFELPLWRWLEAPIPAQFVALGFFFTEGTFNREVQFDPDIYFFGDEITTGLRAYCHGYDFFHPHRVLAWHAYDRAERRCHWNDHREWRARDRSSLARVRRILRGHDHRGFALGTKRTVKSYERWIGMPLVLDGPQ